MEIDLKHIKSPEDIKKLNQDQLELLCEELRAPLISKLGAHGGHVGPNLGVVEATVALHYVFDTPKDRIVFDVSHQTYVHKMLTGRIEAFLDPSHYDDVTGYTNPRESNYDLFEVGHTSTSIALAIGLAKARDIEGGKENVVAFIGDASLGGGEAMEALDYAPELGSNFIIILNDNQMSIAENHGALYQHLTELRKSNGTAENNIFKALGYEYIYVEEGNNVRALIKAFKEARDVDHAVLVHINTMKGDGLPVAERNKEKFHYSIPFDPESGEPLNHFSGESYIGMFANHMSQRMQENGKLITVNAGTPGAMNFTPERRKQAGRQFVDVGICEQEATSVAAGLAKGGCRPVLMVMATFIQRAYDQLSQDIAINNLPSVVVDFNGGVYGIPDVTHLGFFDIAMVSNIPNMVFLAPANAEEYLAAIDWAIGQTEHPVFVRTPAGKVRHADRPVNTNFFKYDIAEQGQDIAIIGAGTFQANALEAAELLRKRGLNPTVINPRNLSQLDCETLDTLKGYKRVITLEDGITDGGFGQKVAAYFGDSEVRVTVLGLRKEFLDRYDIDEVLRANNLTPQQIADLAVNQE